MRRLAGIAGAAAIATGVWAAPSQAISGWPAVPISSTVGSGSFGTWQVDPFGLPSYRYRIDELRSPIARQPELGGSTDAWHQLGNDHIVADAYNHGYVQLWSQDRRYEWTNRYDPAALHFGGGYGYLRVGNRVISTLYDDRPQGSSSERDFGVGYFRHTTTALGLNIEEYVYAPFGNDPVLLHDVKIRNNGSRSRKVTWFEYWDVNPFDQATKTQIPAAAVRSTAGPGTLSATQTPTTLDRHPLTIFAVALDHRPQAVFGDARTFFGSGADARAVPAAVKNNAAGGALAPAGSGRAMFAFRKTVDVPARSSVTLRYAYGAAHEASIGALVSKYRRASSPLRASEQRWRAWLPQIAFGQSRNWLSRELQWDAYTLRSGTTYEECRGRHIISQGGYYQYGFGFQGAFRDPLQHMLPMIYADPSLARDVLLYSAQEQPKTGGQIPYAMSELCHKFNAGNSDDLDLWLLWAAAEYGLGTRDLKVFDERTPFAGGGSGSLWAHLKLAFRHQESLHGPHGGYVALDTGDWSDLSTTFLHMTESMLVSAQAAYIYPRLAVLADARGDHAFAAALRSAGEKDLRTTRAQWTARGWYARGYAGNTPIGTGAIFGEPQPWALLAGAPSRNQAQTLVAHIRRYLTGIDAPAGVHGPALIGSAQSPAAADPGITEHGQLPAGGIAAGAAVFPGGAWYAVNGWLTWALGTVANEVPGARQYAFSELERNTLAAHAIAYPNHWDGTISVDDVCRAFYSPDPASCGAGLTTAYAGQIMHQPAWSLYDAILLAGIEPTARGFRIAPELPTNTFTVSLPEIGVGIPSRRRPRICGGRRERAARDAGEAAREETLERASRRQTGAERRPRRDGHFHPAGASRSRRPLGDQKPGSFGTDFDWRGRRLLPVGPALRERRGDAGCGWKRRRLQQPWGCEVEHVQQPPGPRVAAGHRRQVPVVLDEREDRREVGDLVRDVAAPSPRADERKRDAEAVAVETGRVGPRGREFEVRGDVVGRDRPRGRHVIEVTAMLVVGDEQSGLAPQRAMHHGLDHIRARTSPRRRRPGGSPRTGS